MYIQGEEMNYQCVYPEVYYKVQPFIMMACDEMDSYNMGMPSCDMIRQISDQIYDDVLRVHPDLMMEEEEDFQEISYEAAEAYNLTDNFAESQRFRRRRRPRFFRDLIDILLLTEFFRRRRF